MTVLTREADAPTVAPQTARQGRPRLRLAAVVLAPIVVLGAGFFAFATYREGVQYVSTDNAQLTGQPVQVGSANAGRVDSLQVRMGSPVHRGDVLAEVALPSDIGTAQSGQPKLTFLGLSDSRVDVVAPVDGVVIALPVAIGATVQAGQAIVEIVDPAHLWVNANIDETSIGRLKVGQGVQVHLDALGADVPGSVEAITPATAAVFALLPTSTGSGNFTKIAQLVPVRIGVFLDPTSEPALLGSSAEVKIRVQD